MKLNDDIKNELIVAIKTAMQNGGTFPLEIQTSGRMNHRICTEVQASGYLIETISVDEKMYLIYLI